MVKKCHRLPDIFTGFVLGTCLRRHSSAVCKHHLVSSFWKEFSSCSSILSFYSLFLFFSFPLAPSCFLFYSAFSAYFYIFSSCVPSLFSLLIIVLLSSPAASSFYSALPPPASFDFQLFAILPLPASLCH